MVHLNKTDSVICMIQSLYDQEISCGDSKTDSVIYMIQSLYDQEISCGDSKTDSFSCSSCDV